MLILADRTKILDNGPAEVIATVVVPDNLKSWFMDLPNFCSQIDTGGSAKVVNRNLLSSILQGETTNFANVVNSLITFARNSRWVWLYKELEEE